MTALFSSEYYTDSLTQITLSSVPPQSEISSLYMVLGNIWDGPWESAPFVRVSHAYAFN